MSGWIAWSASVGIDYFIGRSMPSLLADGNAAVGVRALLR
jgi:hypothetical protein